MAVAAKRSSANTDLYVGTLSAAVGLYNTNAKPAGLPKDWSTAGPNGGRLKFETRGAAAPVGMDPEPAVEPGSSDPLATDERAAAIRTGFAIAGSAGTGPALAKAFDAGEAAAGAPSPVETVHELLGDPLPEGPSGAGALVDGEFRRVLVEDGSGELVEPEDVRRGVRLEDGRFIDCTDQLDAIEGRTKLDRMEVVATIDSPRIRRQRVVASHYIGGQDPLSVAKLRLLYDGLRERREVAVVKYTTRKRQQLGVIEADGRTRTLVLLTLVWSEDWREAPTKASAIANVRVPQTQVVAMCSLLAALHDTPDVVDDLRDDAIAMREELLARALAGELAEVVAPLPVADEIPSLEDALTASLAAVKATKHGKV